MNRRIIKSVFVSTIAIVAATSTQAAFAQNRQFNLPSRAANEAIPEFARQAGIQIVAPGGKLRGVRTNPVKGEYDVREALGILVRGTSLKIISDQGSTIMLGSASPYYRTVAADRPSAKAMEPVALPQAPEGTRKNADEEVAQAETAAPSEEHVSEIIVTAQKRSENLQRVPITITALSSSVAKAMGITTTTDLQIATPGLIMHRNTFSLTPSLRGISQSSASPGDESPIAFYVDGVYYSSLSGGIFALNNIERVEVLKGPQGTLFGRNAAGGVVQIITRRPQQAPYVEANVGYGNYDTTEDTFYATTGITPNVATDLAVYYIHQGNGWGKNITTGQDTFRSHEFAVRNKWLVNVGDKTQITLAGDYDKGENPSGSGHDPLPGSQPAYGGPHIGGFYDLRENFKSDNHFTQWGGSIEIDHDFDWSRLVSISAYRGGTPRTTLDQDVSPLNLIDITVTAKSRQVTQEFQLLSPTSSRIKWIAGLFYMHNRVSSSLFENGSIIAPPLTFSATNADSYIDSIAGFGEITVPLGDKTDVTAGVRYTSDKQHIVGGKYTDTGLVANSFADKSATFGKPTWRLAVNHRFTPSLMLYASYNRGFKSGVYNSTAPLNAAVRPSVIDAFEVGEKSEFLDGKLRVNASAFYYNASNLQLQASIIGGTLLFNAAKARIKGAELDLEATPLQGLTLRGNVSYVDSHYRDFLNAPYAFPNPAGGFTVRPGDASGNEMIFSPKWSATASALYQFPTSFGPLQLAGSYYYNGGYFADSPNQYRQKAYYLTEASLGWTSRNDHWNAKLWAKNINNAKYYNHITVTSLNVTGSPSPPRTFGVTFGFKWK
jgi:iron complex outermembrane receptor protein